MNKLMLHLTIVTDLVIGSPLKPVIMTSQHCGLQGPHIYTNSGWCKITLVTMENFV